MTRQHQHTAIFIFARSEKVEARKKVLTKKSHRINRALIRQFNIQTDKIASSTGLKVFWINGDRDNTETFGKKFEKAFQQVFDAGYQNVIAIGNDCPSLTKEKLLFAADQLDSKGLVLGPALDGGVYLLGMNNNRFEQISFSDLPWGTSYLYESFKKQINPIDCQLLSLEKDIDYASDLIHFLKSPGNQPFKLQIKSILPHFSTPDTGRDRKLLVHSFQRKHLVRGPPSVAA